MASHNVLDARNNLSKLIAQSRGGEEVVITKHGKPVAQLVPLDGVDVVFDGPALCEWIAAHPLPERLQRSTTEIDAMISDARDGWE